MKLSTTDELERISGERRPGNSTPAPSSCPWGQMGVKVGGTYLRPKDSNAVVGVHHRATGKALEGADRQTDRLYAPYSKIVVKDRHLTFWSDLTKAAVAIVCVVRFN